jgi:hypothetical protein
MATGSMFDRCITFPLAFRVWFAAASVVVAVAAVSGCESQPRSETWRADSTAYVDRLAKWLRDSTVIDSVTRTVDLTELLLAYDAIVTARNPLTQQSRLDCAQLKVYWDHGALPAP